MTCPERPALHDLACRALANAYAPYTGIDAGVAVRLKDGKTYTGCNFENAAYMHGLDAFEGAAGQILVQGGWALTGTLPEIGEIYYCFRLRPQPDGLYFPGPVSLMLLRLWAAKDIQISYATQQDGIFAAHGWDDLIAHLPPPCFDQAAFGTFARERYAGEDPGTLFREGRLKKLFEARLNAFDPLSHYAVAAMVETESGGAYFGCNCEPGGNKALHAEATALAAMVDQEGPRARISRVTVLTGGDAPGFPCGGCRQYINEFATAETEIVCMNVKGERHESRHADLLPHSFSKLFLDLEWET